MGRYQWLVERRTGNSGLQKLQVNMKIFTVTVVMCLGNAAADTSILASPEFSAQQSLDNTGYYNPYPSAAGYDYDTAYPPQPQSEQDRQDILSTGLGGITIAMFLTAFAAALAGALVAPALSAGISGITEFELPEFTLPEISEKVEDEVRPLKTNYPWVGIVENVYTAVQSELNYRNSHKFDKFIDNSL